MVRPPYLRGTGYPIISCLNLFMNEYLRGTGYPIISCLNLFMNELSGQGICVDSVVCLSYHPHPLFSRCDGYKKNKGVKEEVTQRGQKLVIEILPYKKIATIHIVFRM